MFSILIQRLTCICLGCNAIYPLSTLVLTPFVCCKQLRPSMGSLFLAENKTNLYKIVKIKIKPYLHQNHVTS